MILSFLKSTIFFLLLFFFSSPLKALEGQDTSFGGARQVPNQGKSYIVGIKFSQEEKERTFNSLDRNRVNVLVSAFSELVGLEACHVIYTFEAHQEQKWRHSFQQSFKAQELQSIAAIQLAELRFNSEELGERAFLKLRESKKILFIEKNHRNILQNHNSGDISLKPSRLFSLYENNFLWWHQQIQVSEAMALLKEQKARVLRAQLGRPIVAVLDSGIDYEHSWLKDNIWRNPNPGKTKCDYDLYGCATALFSEGKLGMPKVYPYGTQGAGLPCVKNKTYCGHGTHVAGLIAARNSEGDFLGLCPSCQVMSLKIVSEEKGGAVIFDSSILRALKYIALVKQKLKQPVRLINISFGKYQPSKAVSLFLAYLREEHNILTIAAAGNEKSRKPLYPAALKHVISVAATNSDGQKAYYSNYGPSVDIFAPGGVLPSFGVVSALPGGGAELSQGSSVAAPIVSGLAGLFLSLDSSLSADNLERILLSSKQEEGAYIRKLNAKAAMESFLSEDYKKSEDQQRRVEPFCGEIVGRLPSNRFYLKSLSVWFILILPILILALTKHHEVKL